MKDVSEYIGTVHEVAVDVGAYIRTMSVSVSDAGPLPHWDGRPMLRLTVSFGQDGKRSHWATADAAAGQLAAQIYSPFSVGVLNSGSGFEMAVESEYRKTGPKYGRTSYHFVVFCGTMHSEETRAAAAAEMQAVRDRYLDGCAELGIAPMVLTDDTPQTDEPPVILSPVDAMIARMNARHAARR